MHNTIQAIQNTLQTPKKDQAKDHDSSLSATFHKNQT